MTYHERITEPLDFNSVDNTSISEVDGGADSSAPQQLTTGPWLLNVTSMPWLPFWILALLTSVAVAVGAWLTLNTFNAKAFDMAHVGWAFTAAILPILLIIDMATKRLPDGIVLPSIQIVGGLYLVDAVMGGLTWGDIGTAFGCGVGGYVVYFAIALATRGMGLGDVKFAALLGFALGGMLGPLAVLYAIIIIPGILGIIPAVYLLARGKADAGVPFGPLMALGAAAVMFGLVG